MRVPNVGLSGGAESCAKMGVVTAILSLLVAVSVPNPAAEIAWPPTHTVMHSVTTFTFASQETKDEAARAVKLLKESRWGEAAEISLSLIGKMPPEMFNGKPLPYISIGEKPAVQKNVNGWQWRLELGWLLLINLQTDDAIRQFKLVIDNNEERRDEAREAMAFALVRGGYFREGYNLWNELDTLTDGQKTALGYASTPTNEAWLNLHNLAMSKVMQGPIGGGLPLPNQTAPPKEPSGNIEASLILAEQALRQKNAQQVKLYTNSLGVLLGKDGPPVYKALNMSIQRQAAKL